MTETRGTALTAAWALVSLAGAVVLSSAPAAAQSRGVIIQIPDDVAPGSPRPTPTPAPTSPAPAPQDTAPSAAMPAPKAACQGTACAAPSNAWHVLNTSNKTCLVLSKNDLKGGRDVRKLATLLPAPLFVVASGACP